VGVKRPEFLKDWYPPDCPYNKYLQLPCQQHNNNILCAIHVNMLTDMYYSHDIVEIFNLLFSGFNNFTLWLSAFHSEYHTVSDKCKIDQRY
jgi:hypothetical protein